jgi:hypothetical protein
MACDDASDDAGSCLEFKLITRTAHNGCPDSEVGFRTHATFPNVGMAVTIGEVNGHPTTMQVRSPLFALDLAPPTVKFMRGTPSVWGDRRNNDDGLWHLFVAIQNLSHCRVRLGKKWDDRLEWNAWLESSSMQRELYLPELHPNRPSNVRMTVEWDKRRVLATDGLGNSFWLDLRDSEKQRGGGMSPVENAILATLDRKLAESVTGLSRLYIELAQGDISPNFQFQDGKVGRRDIPILGELMPQRFSSAVFFDDSPYDGRYGYESRGSDYSPLAGVDIFAHGNFARIFADQFAPPRQEGELRTVNDYDRWATAAFGEGTCVKFMAAHYLQGNWRTVVELTKE